MRNKQTENEYRTAAWLAIAPKLFIVLIIIACIIKACVGTKVDPMDNSINKSREIIAHVQVVDSTHNGFRVIYASQNGITKERLTEMENCESFIQAIARLKEEAPKHFGSMLETDIYDFARFVLQYKIDADYTIHNIFVYGYEKKELYIGPNPQITKPAKWIDPNTDQGILYIKEEDIYDSPSGKNQIYRYWKCYGNQAISFTDERFSHFSEDERIY